MTSRQPFTVGSLIGLAILSAFVASLIASFLLTLFIVLHGLGDGGFEAAVSSIPILIAMMVIGLVCGLPALVLVGIPSARIWHEEIRDRPHLALVTGTSAGLLAATLVAAVLGFDPPDFFIASLLFGGVYGATWIWLLQAFDKARVSWAEETDV